MVQLPLVPLRVIDDYGPVGKGASAARYVLAESGNEYIIKGPSLTPQHRYVAANELIAAGLAQLLGLPILDHRVLEMGGRLFFGSSWMPGGSFDPAITEQALRQCQNRERVYDIVVFDVWLCNIDRHHENLVVRRSRQRQSASSTEQMLLLLNDHSHCLILPGKPASDLSNLMDTPLDRYRRLDFLWGAVTELERLKGTLESIERLTDNAITVLIQSIPEELLPLVDQQAVQQFLTERRSRLHGIMEAGRSYLPNLEGGPL